MYLTPSPPLPSEGSSPTKFLPEADTVSLLVSPPQQHVFFRVFYALARCGIVGEVAIRAAMHTRPDGTALLEGWQLACILGAMVLPVDLVRLVLMRVLAR